MRSLVAALTVIFVGACRCGSEPEDPCGTIEVTFESPKDGDTVPSTLSVTVNVTRDGGAVPVSTATLATRLASSGGDFGPARTASVDNSRATFSGVTLEPGLNLLKASVQTQAVGDTPECTAGRTITVSVDNTMIGDPDVVSFSFVGDANNDKVITLAEVMTPPIQARITAQRAEMCTVTIKSLIGSMDTVGTGTIMNGAATIALMLPDVGMATYQLRAELTNCSGGRMHNAAADPEASSNLVIDRVPPTCSVLAPTRAVLGPLDDADTAAALFQVDARGMGSSDSVTLELRINSNPPQSTGPQAVGNGTLSDQFDLPAADGMYRIEFIATDAVGNTCVAQRDITVDFTPPSVEITSPTVAMSPYNTFNVDLSANIDGGIDGTATFSVTGASTATIGPVPVTGTSVTVPHSFAAVGMHTVTVSATDAVGNTIPMPFPSVTVQINGAGCPLTFTRPASNPALLTPADDLNAAMPDLQYEFRLQTSTACAARTVTLYRGTGPSRTMLASGTPNAGGLFVSQQTLPDSNNVAVIFEAEIDDGSGNITRPQISVTTTLSLPGITLPSAMNSPVNVGQDLDRAAPGAQRSLVFSPNVPPGYSAVVCSSVQLMGSPGPCPGDAAYFVMPGGNNLMTTTPAFTFPDGTYTMKIVFTNGVTHVQGTVTSPFVVDTVRPQVSMVTIQGDANADKRLNLAELPTGNPVAQISVTGAEDMSPVTVTYMGMQVGAGTVTGGSATITLTGLAATPTTEQDYAIAVTVRDAAGNANVTGNPTIADPLNLAALFTLRIDRVRPVSTLQLPNQAQLGVAADADPAAGYQLRVTASTSADVGTNGLRLAVTGGNNPQPQDVTPTASTGTALFDVATTGTTTYTVTATATDQSGNVETTPPTRMVTVDLDVPTCNLTAPTAAAQPPGGYTDFAIQTTATIGGADGLQALVFTRIGTAPEQQIDSIAITGGMVSKVVTYPGNGMQVVRVEVTDLAGNSCTDSETITINAMGCPISFTAPAANPAFLNRTHDTNPSTATTLEYTLAGNTGCPNAQIRFFRGMGAGRTELPGSPAMTNGTGGFSFPIALPEGAELLSADMNVNVPTTNSVNVTVDLTPPTLTNVVPSGATLTFVAPENLNLLPPANPAFVADTSTGGAGAQFNVTLNVTGAIGGTAEVYYQGGAMPVGGPVTISADGPLTGGIPVSLPHDTTGTLEIRVSDQAGNRVSSTSMAVVDVVRPDMPVTFTGSVVAGEERFARINLNWSPSGDDGAVSSGAHAGYIVRWTNSTVVPGGLTSPAEFFDSSRVFTGESDSPWSATPINRVIVTPPLTTIYAYARAKDEVGNYSDMASATVDNRGMSRVITLANPRPGATNTDQFGFFMGAGGSLNNDTVDDLVVGYGATAPNRVYVYYGGATLGTAAPQEIVAPEPDQMDGGFWSGIGLDVSIGNVGDDVPNAGANARADLLIGAGLSWASAGRAVLYFGSATATQLDTSAANSVIFVGAAGQALGRTSQIIGDINGDGLSEILIAAPSESGNRGRIYLFFGRTIPQWKALPQPITSASADRSFWGPTPVASGGNLYGRARSGMATIGAFGSGRPDFAMAASRESLNRVNIFSGDAVVTAAAGTTYTTGTDVSAPDQSLQTLTSPPGISLNGFGNRVEGGFDAVGTTAKDVLIAYPAVGELRLYDRTAQLLSTPFTTIRGPGGRLFGNDARMVDFTGDGRPEVAVGENSLLAGNGFWLFRNSGVAGSEFDTSTDAGFFHVQIPSAGGRMGVGLVIGDFNADMKADIAVSDDRDATGKVFIWH